MKDGKRGHRTARALDVLFGHGGAAALCGVKGWPLAALAGAEGTALWVAVCLVAIAGAAAFELAIRAEERRNKWW